MTTDPGEWSPDRWFLTAAERRNDATALDLRAAARIAWTTGNRVRPPDRRNLLAAPGRLPAAGRLLARIGRPARGIVFLLAGVTIAAEALAYRPGSFGRVTEDVRVALQAPWGRLLLGLLAAGLVAFAAYELAAAVYRREPLTIDEPAPRRWWAALGRH